MAEFEKLSKEITAIGFGMGRKINIVARGFDYAAKKFAKPEY